MGKLVLGYTEDEKRSTGFSFHCRLIEPDGSIKREGNRLRSETMSLPPGIYDVTEMTFLGRDLGPCFCWPGRGVEEAHATKWIVLTVGTVLKLPPEILKVVAAIDSKRPIDELLSTGELFIGINACNLDLWEKGSLPDNAKESRMKVSYQPEYP